MLKSKKRGQSYAPLSIVAKDWKVFTIQEPGKDKCLLVFACDRLAREYIQTQTEGGVYLAIPLDDGILSAGIAAGCKFIDLVAEGTEPFARCEIDRAKLRLVSDKLQVDPSLAEFDPGSWPSAN